MFERGIRGGLTFVNQHFATKKTFINENRKEQWIHLAYFDQNNLYGSYLCKQLPYQDFSWGDPSQFTSEESILNLDDEGEEGYVFMVDLSYPSNIHGKTSDFPP